MIPAIDANSPASAARTSTVEATRAPNNIDTGTMIVVSRMSEPMRQIKENGMNDKPNEPPPRLRRSAEALRAKAEGLSPPEGSSPPDRRDARRAPTIAQSAAGSI
jgi:hypothetical protein